MFKSFRVAGALILASPPLFLAGCTSDQAVNGSGNTGNNSISQGVNAPDASVPVSVLGGQSTAKARTQPDKDQNAAPK